MVGTGAVGEGTEGRLECLGESWVFAVGSGESVQQGRDSHRWTPLSPCFASLRTLETECFLLVGRAKLTLKASPRAPILSRRRQIHHWGKAGRKFIEKALWMLV